jgi:hypothetical protein
MSFAGRVLAWENETMAAPGVQLNHMVTVINASLEGWRVSHLFLTDAH